MIATLQTPQAAIISRPQLVQTLQKRKGAQVISIVTETDPGKSKAHKGQCLKRSYVNGMIGWHYVNAVNRQRGREGNAEDFQVKPRKWGVRVKGTPFVEHKGNLYLEMKVEKVFQTQYLIGGVVVPRERVEDHLRLHRPSSPSQGIDKEVILRDYKLESIIQVTLGGNTYMVR